MERSMKRFLVLLAALVLILAMAGCGKRVDSAPSLSEALAAEGTQTIKLTEDLVLTEPMTVTGNKTISGTGTITLNITDAAAGAEGPGFSLLGCPKLTAEDWSADAAVLQVAEGASLTLEGDIIIDGAGVSNGIVALKGATVTLTENAVVQNGLNCGIYVCENATLNVSGGSVLTSQNHGVVNMGTMNVTGGSLSGAEKGAVIYSAGTLDISEGVITGGGVHNIYAAAGSVNVTGGKIDFAAKDGIVVANGATATVTGGAIENCGTHGLCNSGEMTTGAINLYECGIANNAGGNLNVTDTTVEIAPVYCLANMGGTVTATNFSALSCDVTAVCNFAGDMVLDNLTVSNSRAGNISNESGNLTVNGAKLGLCREKPINVGSGVVRMDNVTVEGTTGEHFGAFIYGGEFYLSNSTISFINYSALRADGQCYVELNNVTVDDTMASGIWARGGTIVANKLTLNNIRGHAVNNAGGNITITDMKATDIGKNAIIQDNGITTLTSVSFQNVGDQGAYVKDGTLNITDAWFDNIAQNGVYSLPDSTAKVNLTDVTYSNIAKYGLNNGYAMSAKNVTISGARLSAVLNKKEMYLQDVKIFCPVKDGIYNDTGAKLTMYDTSVEKAGKESTAVFNRGEILAYGMTIKDSENGLTNKETGVINAENVTISGITNYGIRNQGKIENISKVSISGTGNHGINNEKGSFFDGNGIVISGVLGEDANAIYNYAADMVLTNVTVSGGKSHGIFNRGNIVGSQITISNTGEVSYYNYDGGLSDITDLTVSNSGNHAVCNLSQMSLTNLVVNGTVKGCGIMNGQIEEQDSSGKVTKEGKAGTMDLLGSVVIADTASHGVGNVQKSTITGNADISVKNPNNTTANGIYNRGSDMTVAAISIIGDKYGLSNTGTLNAATITVADTVNNGVHNTGTITTSGDASITNVYGATNGDNQGNGIYNTGNMTVGGNLTIDSITAKGNTGNSSNNAIFNRGTLTANGNVSLGNVTAGHAIIGTAGSISFPGTVTVNGTVGKDNIIYFYSGAKAADFGNLIKTSNVDKVVMKVDGSTQVNVDAGTLTGKSKDVVVSNGSAVVTLNNVAITGGNNALHAAGGDIVANNVTVDGSTIGINIRNANSEVTVRGASTISNTTHGSAVHVNSKGKLNVEGSLTVNSKDTQVGVNVYAGSTLKLTGGTLTINNAKKSLNVDGIVEGDAASVITVNNSANEHGIYVNGTFNVNGTVNVSGAAAGDFRLVECAGGTTTIGTLNRADSTAREVLRANNSAVVTVSGGTINGGSGKDVVLANHTSTINISNVTINGGNAAIRGNGGNIIASSIAVDGSTIGINITNGNSKVTVKGASTVSNTTHGSAVHVNKGGTLSIEGGSLTVNSNSNQTGVNVYADSTLNLVGGTLVINNAKKSLNVEGTVTGDAASVITVNNNSAAEYGIYQNGTFHMNGTVNITNTVAGDKQLVLAKKDTTIGVLNASTTAARPILTTDGTVTVTVNGGTVTGHKSKDVFTAPANGTLNISNVTINGGNNALYTTGGTINGTNITLSGSVIAINESNANGVVTLSGANTFANTTHGTCLHIRGKLTVNAGASLTIQDPANVGFKIYKTGTLTLSDGSALSIVNCQKGWNTETGYTFTRGENVTVTVNGADA